VSADLTLVATTILWTAIGVRLMGDALWRWATRPIPARRTERPGPTSWFTARRQRRHDTAVVEQLPDVVDLLRLTTQAGLPVTSALGAIGSRPGGPMGTAFARAATQSARGAVIGDVLPLVVRICGPPARNLVDALLDHDRYGTPLGPALDRLAVEARLRRRRRAEETARRLPVLLLFPLVLTVFPAFVLLAVVPLLAGSLESLSL
jgi:tight adherence protein C